MKIYEKPDIEFIALRNQGGVDYEQGSESNMFD